MLDFVRGPLGDLLAVVEHRNSLADTHHDFHVMLDEKNGKAKFLLRKSDQLHELDFLGRVHPCSRLPKDFQQLNDVGVNLALLAIESGSAQQSVGNSVPKMHITGGADVVENT